MYIEARHAGQRAAALAGKSTGDLNITPEERSELEQKIPCVIKDQQYKHQRKGTYQKSSAGVLALISSCGLFVAVEELYGAE